MSEDVIIHSKRQESLVRFLNLNDFDVEDLGEGVLRVARAEELPVFLKVNDGWIYYEVDLGDISELAGEAFYFKLLDLNTEILPVSFAINATNPEDPRLVLVESRETNNLDDHELLSVFDALELAADKATEVLTTAMA